MRTPFTNTLHAVANILNRRHICEKQIQLVYCGNCISSAEQLIAHIAENVEKQRILEPFVSVHKTFHSETDKLAVLDVGVTIEVLAFRTFAHGVKSKTDILQHFFGIKMFFS